MSLLALLVPLAPSAFAGAASSPDPLRSRQFGLDQVRAPAAWAAGLYGSATLVAVVDSGVDLTHGDLASNLVPGATFLGCPHRSCGNGDWSSGPSSRRASRSPHGTHVAGIIAAVGGNRLGVVGVAPRARIMPIKVLDAQGGSFADIAAGVNHAVRSGAKVINLSLSAPPLAGQAFSLTGLDSELGAALAFAASRGVVVVAASGNDSVPLCNDPGFAPSVLCVAATDRRELPSFYSNFAINSGLLGIAAPGGAALGCGRDVISTLPARSDVADPCRDGVSFGELAGTSMAAPHVSGAAAILVGQGRSRASVVRALCSTARTPGLGRGYFTPSYGFGIVDLSAAIRAPR